MTSLPHGLFSIDELRAYNPRKVDGFSPLRIVLAKGSNTFETRRRFAANICATYPEAEVIEDFDTPHNRVNLGVSAPLPLHEAGKRTLVLAEHKSAVRHSTEEGNSCPNYWHFSPYGFCPYGCAYCYLAGTRGVWFSPTVKVFLNLDEMLARIDRIARQESRATAFYLGKLQDGLALDPLTGYSRIMIPFFGRHQFARLIVLTKAADVSNLLDLDHAGRTLLSWSLNPPEVCDRFEENTPEPDDRIEAMSRCAQAGYPIRAVVMPVIPVPDWREVYERFLTRLLRQVPLDRITLGGICSYGSARLLMEAKLGGDNVVSRALAESPGRSRDGRNRYRASLRVEVYRHLIDVIRRRCPDLQIGLCLEEQSIFEALDMSGSIGKCNCVL